MASATASVPPSVTTPTAKKVRARPIGYRLTLEGWVWLVVVLMLFGVGIGKNINLLALLGCLLFAVLLLSALEVGRDLRRIEARRVADEQVVAGMVGQVTVYLRLQRGRAVNGVRVEERGQNHARYWYLEQIRRDDDVVLYAEVVPQRRGWYDFAPLTVASRYPFGLVRRRLVVSEPLRILVLPQPGKLSRERLRQHLRGADPRADRVHRRGWRHETAQADFHGLRPFRPGDSPRWIHWRSSARRGELLVREFEDVPGDDLLLVVDTCSPAGGGFEALLSLVAGVVHAWCTHRGDRLVMVLSGMPAVVLDGPTGPEHARILLEALATATPLSPNDASVATANEQTVEAAAGLGVHFGAVVASCGDSALPGALERALGRDVVHLDIIRHTEWEFYTAP